MYPDRYRNPAEDPELEQIEMQMHDLQRRRRDILKASGKTMDPKDERLAELAYEAGMSMAGLRAANGKIKELEEANKELREDVSDLRDYKVSAQAWQKRAEKAEESLKRSQRAKKAVAKRKRRAAK